MTDEEVRTLAREAELEGSPEAMAAWVRAAAQQSGGRPLEDPRAAAVLLAMAGQECLDLDGSPRLLYAVLHALDHDEPVMGTEILRAPPVTSAWARRSVRTNPWDPADACVFGTASPSAVVVGAKLVVRRKPWGRQPMAGLEPRHAWPVLGPWRAKRSLQATRGEARRIARWTTLAPPGTVAFVPSVLRHVLAMLDSAVAAVSVMPRFVSRK